MTKEQIIKLYIADLNNLVADSDAKRNRIMDLEDELEALKQGQSLTIDSVSKRTEAKRKLDDEFTHYEPSVCGDIAVMRECENGAYIEREDAHLIIDKYVS